MNYLFYDLECANCRNKCAKISSFGYVLTDENFKIIKKENILINPEAGFYFNDKETKKLVISNPDNLEDYLKSPNYKEAYEKIKSIMSMKDTYYIGYGNDSDAYYFMESNKRYGLNNFNYRYIDLKDIFRFVFKDKPQIKRMNRISLASAAKWLYIEFNQKHDSLDDSFMTMKILRKTLNKAKNSFSELITLANAVYHVNDNNVYRIVNGEKTKIEKVIYPDMEEPEEEGYIDPQKR